MRMSLARAPMAARSMGYEKPPTNATRIAWGGPINEQQAPPHAAGPLESCFRDPAYARHTVVLAAAGWALGVTGGGI